MRHLELKRRVWWLRIGIPKDCERYFERRGLHRISLRTGDVGVAKARRDGAEREFMALVC